MRKPFAVWALLAMGLGLITCGGEDPIHVEELVQPDWTLTFLAPAHGSSVSSPMDYELAISGPGVVRAEELPFDLGFFANDVLVHQSRDRRGTFSLPAETHSLKVKGIDAEGLPVEKVLGDEIRIKVGDSPGEGDGVPEPRLRSR